MGIDLHPPPPPPLPLLQHAVGPVFHLNQYDVNEGGQVVVRLSAPILSEPLTSPFTGSIKVDITTEDLPSGDTRQNAQFGKCHLSAVHLL